MTRDEHIAAAKKLFSDAIDSASMGIMSMQFGNTTVASRIAMAIDHIIAAVETKEKENE